MAKGKKGISLGGKIALVFAGVIVVAGVTVWAVINNKLGKIGKIENVVPINKEDETFEQTDNNGGEKIDTNDADKALNGDDIKLMTDSDVINILFVGSDGATASERTRSDAMIICSLNRKRGEIKLVSLLRDMYVSIPGYSNNRINASYAFGGMPLLDQTIEKNFGVKIDGNVAVNFESFMEAIAQIGDVNIELNAKEANHLNTDAAYRDKNWKLHEGVNTLTPEQLLAYSRIRHVGNGDWERTDRQRKVILAAFAKVRDLGLDEMLSLADKVLPCIATDMDKTTILNLVRLVFAKKMSIVQTARIPVDNTWSYKMVEKMGVILPDLKKNSEALHDILYGATETADAQSNTVQNK